MKRLQLIFASALLLVCSNFTMAGVTTYTFTSADWKSKVGTTVCDNQTDGWISDKAGADYSSTYQIGVKVTDKQAFTGAGATSVQSFREVRRITFNYATTTKGQGSIHVQVGDNVAIDSVVTISNPSNRDLTVVLPEEQTGKITFQVNCTRNSIYLNSISIYSASGGSNPFTVDTYQLVTDVSQLLDSDQIIIGVFQDDVHRIMGYFDENVSQNNIHSIAGKYTADRTQVGADDRAVYTLHRTELEGKTVFYIQDELRYEEAYLVANGGQTKNRLAVWNKLYDSKTYGNYGYWDIIIVPDGRATVMNLGKSKGRYLQYNASGSLFGCYADAGSQTAVCIYRCVRALGDTTAIVAPLTNFGTVCLHGEHNTGAKTLTINANGLMQDIDVRLKGGAPFSLSATRLDRDGGSLTISYDVAVTGYYQDTLLLSSGDVYAEAVVLLHATRPMKVAEAVHVADYTTVYLDTVVVTKKYDSYIFVRDATGAILIYDQGDANGRRYGSGLMNGDVLTGVVGRAWNYYGVPELMPIRAWKVGAKREECLPEVVSAQLDSADVCRYVRLPQLIVGEDNMATASYLETPLSVDDAFNVGLTCGVETTMDAVVMIVWDEVQLWCVEQEVTADIRDVPKDTLEGTRKIVKDGRLMLIHHGKTYSSDGRLIH